MSSNLDLIRACITETPRSSDNGSDFKVVMTQYEGPTGMTPQKVMGNFPMILQPGDWYSFEGSFVPDKYKKGAEVFKARKIRPDLPMTERGVIELLSTTFKGAEFGVTSQAISNFVRKYGAKAAHLAEDDPTILLSLADKRHGNFILNAWTKCISSRKPLLFLKEANVSKESTDAILHFHKDMALQRIKADPYGLIRINGVSFTDVDKIGRHLGIQSDDIRRISAALLDCIAEDEKFGHTIVAVDTLVDKMKKRDLTMSHLGKFAVTDINAQQSGVAFDATNSDVAIQSYGFHKMETAIATRLAAMLKRAETVDKSRVDAITAQVLAQSKFAHFDDIQKDAVRLCAREPVAILTGGPGTGKSTVTEAIVEVMQLLGTGKLFPMAPTGKAAVRLKETTGHPEVVTVHSSLKSTGEDGDGSFARNAANPYPDGAIIIVDEASMLDTRIFNALLEAMPANGKLLLVGDRYQLPSVSPGFILGDLITTVAPNGARIPCAELKNVYRSSADSEISTGAVEVRNGTFDISRLDNIGRGGVRFDRTRNRDIAPMVVELVKLIKTSMRLDPKRDIGILCAQKEQFGGTRELNRALQAELNPLGREVDFLAPMFQATKNGPCPRTQDRVMLTKNIATKGVANGDVGILIEATSPDPATKKKGSVTVAFETNVTVTFTESEARDLIVAYAITGHKSQGSQYKAVIMSMSSDFDPRMQYRSLTYTMWTRAKNALFIVGDEQAFNNSLQNTKPSQRSTRLPYHLKRQLNAHVKPTAEMLNCNADMIDHNKAKTVVSETTATISKEATATGAASPAPVAVMQRPIPGRPHAPMAAKPAPALAQPRPMARGIPRARPQGVPVAPAGPIQVPAVNTPAPIPTPVPVSAAAVERPPAAPLRPPHPANRPVPTPSMRPPIPRPVMTRPPLPVPAPAQTSAMPQPTVTQPARPPIANRPPIPAPVMRPPMLRPRPPMSVPIPAPVPEMEIEDTPTLTPRM